jgi:hypothetical protein
MEIHTGGPAAWTDEPRIWGIELQIIETEHLDATDSTARRLCESGPRDLSLAIKVAVRPFENIPIAG